MRVRVLNPGSGSTYHPKIYLGSHGGKSQAVIGSANLTGGLATNVEAAVWLSGRRSETPIARAWDLAESLWSDPRGEGWQPGGVAEKDEEFEPELLALVSAAARKDPVFRTLGPKARENLVTEVTPSEVTSKSATSPSTTRRTSSASEGPAWLRRALGAHQPRRGFSAKKALVRIALVLPGAPVAANATRRPGPGSRVIANRPLPRSRAPGKPVIARGGAAGGPGVGNRAIPVDPRRTPE